jgi:hypothetical protein
MQHVFCLRLLVFYGILFNALLVYAGVKVAATNGSPMSGLCVTTGVPDTKVEAMQTPANVAYLQKDKQINHVSRRTQIGR